MVNTSTPSTGNGGSTIQKPEVINLETYIGAGFTIFFGLALLFVAARKTSSVAGGVPGVGGYGEKESREFLGGISTKAGKSVIHDKPVTFNDVAGVPAAKASLEEIVTMLKQPEKYLELGAKLPKGVLLVGPPGTGKTLLARTVACEAGVPFLSASGSEFVEMYVGVGAKRVRELFEKARKHPACIVFVDELDAVGKRRDRGPNGGNDEREQTLNQLLVCMDGIDSGESTVIVIAATNIAETLDPALLRPGRFDRRVQVGLPSLQGRYEILRVHGGNKKLGPDVDLNRIARRTCGFSGADLANLLNEAAIRAGSQGDSCITMDHINYGLDVVRTGRKRDGVIVSEAEKRILAVHEVGHALLISITSEMGAHRVGQVSILPRDNGAAGITEIERLNDSTDLMVKSLKGYLVELVTIMGGRAAEILSGGLINTTTGSSGDMASATNIASHLVKQCGFGPKTGMFSIDERFGKAPLSQSILEKMDNDIRFILDNALACAHYLLNANRELFYLLVEEVLAKEEIGQGEWEKLIAPYMPGVVSTHEFIEEKTWRYTVSRAK